MESIKKLIRECLEKEYASIKDVLEDIENVRKHIIDVVYQKLSSQESYKKLFDEKSDLRKFVKCQQVNLVYNITHERLVRQSESFDGKLSEKPRSFYKLQLITTDAAIETEIDRIKGLLDSIINAFRRPYLKCTDDYLIYTFENILHLCDDKVVCDYIHKAIPNILSAKCVEYKEDYASGEFFNIVQNDIAESFTAQRAIVSDEDEPVCLAKGIYVCSTK